MLVLRAHLLLIIAIKNVRLKIFRNFETKIILIFQRDAALLRPYKFMMAIGCFMSFLILTSVNWFTVAICAASVLIHGYLFICFHSLHLKFKNENDYKLSEEEQQY